MKYLHLLKYKDLVLITVKDRESIFYYEENSCPSNYLGEDTEGVINLENGDTDPHGIFEVVWMKEITDNQEIYLENWLSKCRCLGKLDIDTLIEVMEKEILK